MRAGIAIDSWKLEIFSRHLTQSGYTFEQGTGFSKNALILFVHTENIEALAVVVQAANDEAAATKR